MTHVELELTTDLATFPRLIVFNYDELREQLARELETFRGVTVTEDAVPQAKRLKAYLNSFRNALEVRRKEVKAAVMAPYIEFEGRTKSMLHKKGNKVKRPMPAGVESVASFPFLCNSESAAGTDKVAHSHG